MNNNNLYRYALSKLIPTIFEQFSIIFISDKFPSIGLRFPSDHAGGDGGEDAWDELYHTKYAFSIENDWSGKLKEEIEKVGNSKTVKKVKKIRYITNQDISTIKVNNFKKKNSELIANLKLEVKVYALNELTIWLEGYFSTTSNIELYNLLGISSLLVGERGLISFGFNNNEENLEGFLENDNQYNKEISYHDLNSNSAYQDPRKIVSNNVIFDLLNECLAKNENYHYLISADAGMGKSYEMKKTAYLLHKKAEAENQKDLMERKPSIQAYYYPLCTYTSDTSSPWKEFTPKHPQERFYVFLDGFDELAEENQNILIKKIQEEFRNRPQTFFVISARPLSFSYTSIASVFDTRTIKANISIPDSKSTREQSFKEIPFFRDLISKLNSPDDATRTFLIKKAIKNDYRRRAESANANLDSLFEKKLDSLLSYTCKFTQTLINKNTWSKEHVSNFLEEIDKEDQKEFLSFLNDSMFISLLSDDNYSFSHNIYKEYLTAFNLLDMYKKEIPNVFLTGINNELIKSKYYNTYSLWLSLLSEDKELKPLYEKAIEFVLNEENIQTLFLCDQSIFSSNDILNIVETTFEDYEKYRFIIYPYAPVLSSYINDIDNTGENKFIDQLIEKIKTMIVNDEIIHIDIDLHFLENILKQNKEQVRYQEEVKNLLNLLIDTINKNNPQERYDELFPIIFLLESIIRLFEPEFNSYEYLEKNVDTSYKQEFKNEQRAIDFYSDYNQNTEDVDGAIERHETNLLDVIWPMITLKKTGFKAHYAPGTLTDTYKRKVNPFKMDYFEYFLGKFAHRYTDSTEESLPKIPTKLRKFILEALEQILSKIETENIDTYSNHIYTNRTLSHIKSIFLRMCIGILPDELDQVENIFFSHNIALMELFMHDDKLFTTIVEGFAKDEMMKIKWLEKSLDLGSKYGDRTIYPYRFIKIILNSLVDMDSLEKHIEIIDGKYQSDTLNTSIENIYKFTLDYLMHSHPLKDTIKDKISDDYNRFWKDRDEKQKVSDAKREELLKALNDTATDNIGNEIKSLFDKAKFKEAAFKILDVLDENDSDYNNLTYSAMAFKITEQREIFDINYQLPDPIINYHNQIVLMFLWRYAKNISRDQLEKLINSDEWVAWVFIIIINLCIEPPNESKDRALQNDKLDFKKLYTKHLLEKDTLGKFNELFSELEKLDETDTIRNIKLIIYIWESDNGIKKEFTDDNIYGFIQCIGLRHHNLIDINSDKSSYAHITDNLLDKDNAKVVAACKKYIEENKKRHPTDNTNISIITKHIINYLVENNERDDTLDENILLIHLSYKKHDLLLGATRNYIEHNNLYSKLEEKFCKEGIVKYLELLDSGMQFHFITHIILEHREVFKESIASLKRIFNKPINNISKYDLVFTVLDKNTDALKWLTDYFTEENGDLTHSYIYDHYENLTQIINSYSFESNADLDNIIKLLNYSFDENNDSVRREQIGKYAFMWLSNSATQDNLQYIKDKLIEKTNSNKRLGLALNNRTYLRDLEEKAFSKEKNESTKPNTRKKSLWTKLIVNTMILFFIITISVALFFFVPSEKLLSLLNIKVEPNTILSMFIDNAISLIVSAVPPSLLLLALYLKKKIKKFLMFLN